MPTQVAVHLLPPDPGAERLSNTTAVVIDVLRASTTITHALSAGARCVIPCLEIDQARRVAAEKDGDVLLGGSAEPCNGPPGAAQVGEKRLCRLPSSGSGLKVTIFRAR